MKGRVRVAPFGMRWVWAEPLVWEEARGAYLVRLKGGSEAWVLPREVHDHDIAECSRIVGRR